MPVLGFLYLKCARFGFIQRSSSLVFFAAFIGGFPCVAFGAFPVDVETAHVETELARLRKKLESPSIKSSEKKRLSDELSLALSYLGGLDEKAPSSSEGLRVAARFLAFRDWLYKMSADHAHSSNEPREFSLRKSIELFVWIEDFQERVVTPNLDSSQQMSLRKVGDSGGSSHGSGRRSGPGSASGSMIHSSSSSGSRSKKGSRVRKSKKTKLNRKPVHLAALKYFEDKEFRVEVEQSLADADWTELAQAFQEKTILVFFLSDGSLQIFFHDFPIGSGRYRDVYSGYEFSFESETQLERALLVRKVDPFEALLAKDIEQEDTVLQKLVVLSSGLREDQKEKRGLVEVVWTGGDFTCLEKFESNLWAEVWGGENTFSVHERYEISKQILVGLKTLHSHGILHLDLKPDNILVSKTPKLRVAISDFGLSLDLSKVDLSRPELWIEALLGKGTLQWLPPESLEYLHTKTNTLPRKISDSEQVENLKKVDGFSAVLLACRVFHYDPTQEVEPILWPDETRHWMSLRNLSRFMKADPESQSLLAHWCERGLSSTLSERPNLNQLLGSLELVQMIRELSRGKSGILQSPRVNPQAVRDAFHRTPGFVDLKTHRKYSRSIRELHKGARPKPGVYWIAPYEFKTRSGYGLSVYYLTETRTIHSIVLTADLDSAMIEKELLFYKTIGTLSEPYCPDNSDLLRESTESESDIG